jgi:hypothetical protein
MSTPKLFSTEPRAERFWIRGIFQLLNGRHAAQRATACTVRRDFTLNPGDDEWPAIVFNNLWEELQTVGYDFPEGHGILIAILGSMSDVA